MKKTTLITLLAIGSFSIVNYGALAAIPAGAAGASAAFNRAEMAAQLPPDLSVPAVLPPGIQDPSLLEAWIHVNEQQADIQLWQGATVSGHGLAQYLLEQTIPVVWDEENVCGSSSCSVLHCAAEVCTYDDDQPGADPIYVASSERGDMQGLITILAHETFHRTQPFGLVHSTRFEEYWAFFIGARLSRSDWPDFGANDPLDPNHLALWFVQTGMSSYLEYPEYPAAVAAMVYSEPYGGDPYSGIPAEAFGASQSR